MKLSYLDLMTTDPSYNLAMEQYVFDCLPRDRMYFMLWQNDNAIIVGKYQNTIAEINEEAVRERGIRVVRRLSGGGAVYHDMGNLNFTFITDVGESNALNLKLFCEPVVRTLATLGVKAEVNGRNDITIDGKKFSGNSQYIRQGRVMHHGTIMFDFGPLCGQRGAARRPDKDPDQGHPLGAQPRDERCRASAGKGHAAGIPPHPAGKHPEGESGRGLPADAGRPCGGGEATRGALRHLGVELRLFPGVYNAAPPPRGRLRPDRGLHHRGARKDRGPDIQGRLFQRLGTGRAGGALCWLHTEPRGL